MSKMTVSNIHHVMVLGCGRSGTSIFGELFDHLSPFTYYSEPSYGELLELDFTHPIAVKVPRESPDYAPTVGLSFPLEHLLTASPGPWRFYWIVRHPLDTIASLKVGISKKWGHHPRPLDWKNWLDRPLIEQCAHHWNYINSVGFQQVKQLVRVMRFEEMLHDPALFAKTVCKETGLDPEQHELDLSSWAQRVQNTNNELFIEAKTSRPYSRSDHTVRIGRWKENLDTEDIERIIPLIAVTARHFGYDIPDGVQP
jgi:hypothetical protein